MSNSFLMETGIEIMVANEKSYNKVESIPFFPIKQIRRDKFHGDGSEFSVVLYTHIHIPTTIFPVPINC